MTVPRQQIIIAGDHVKELPLPGCGGDAQLVGLPVNRHQLRRSDSKTERGRSCRSARHGTGPTPAPCATSTTPRPPARHRHRGPPAPRRRGHPRRTRLAPMPPKRPGHAPAAGRSAGNQPDGAQQHGLARSGLAGDRGHSPGRREQGTMNRAEVMNFQLLKHGRPPARRKKAPRPCPPHPLHACAAPRNHRSSRARAIRPPADRIW